MLHSELSVTSFCKEEEILFWGAPTDRRSPFFGHLFFICFRCSHTVFRVLSYCPQALGILRLLQSYVLRLLEITSEFPLGAASLFFFFFSFFEPMCLHYLDGLQIRKKKLNPYILSIHVLPP